MPKQAGDAGISHPPGDPATPPQASRRPYSWGDTTPPPPPLVKARFDPVSLIAPIPTALGAAALLSFSGLEVLGGILGLTGTVLGIWGIRRTMGGVRRGRSIALFGLVLAGYMVVFTLGLLMWLVEPHLDR